MLEWFNKNYRLLIWKKLFEKTPPASDPPKDKEDATPIADSSSDEEGDEKEKTQSGSKTKQTTTIVKVTFHSCLQHFYFPNLVRLNSRNKDLCLVAFTCQHG